MIRCLCVLFGGLGVVFGCGVGWLYVVLCICARYVMFDCGIVCMNVLLCIYVC